MSASGRANASTVGRALRMWGLEDSTSAFVAQRENEVHRVTMPDGGQLALRLHRPGYRNGIELRSELEWMAMLHAAGVSVPEPKPSCDGQLLHEVDGRHVDILTWLDGSPLWPDDPELDSEARVSVVAELGATMARIHALSDEWTPGTAFARPDWGHLGLLGETPVWGRFWEHPGLSPDERACLERFRVVADGVLADVGGQLDSGLIHGDLVRQNVLVSAGSSPPRLHIIDFDDSAFGYRVFDIATTIHTLRTEADSSELRAALLTGYRSVRQIDTEQLELFDVLRACTYVGWIADRLDEPDATARSLRYIDLAVALASAYLSGTGIR